MKMIRKMLRTVVVGFALTAVFCSAPAFLRAAASGEAQAAAEPDREKALIHKEKGDEFRRKGDIGSAAEQYGKALSLHSGFSREDRFTMARHLSWVGRHDEAVRELRAILSEDPGNLAVRTHLARTLAWKGDLRGSLEESSMVLAASPGDKDALLARANALKWSGDRDAAVSIYKGILERGEDFDTRLGLSHAFLSEGYVRGAREGSAQLKPQFPYQEKERSGLDNEIRKAVRPTLGAGYGYYSDSDDNRVDRYSLSADFWTGHWKWGIGLLETRAEGPSGDAESRELVLSVESRPAEWFGAGAFAGAARTSDGGSETFAVGGLHADARLFGGKVGAGVARRVFADTAELIGNRIRFTEMAAFFERPLPNRFSFRAGYAGRDYSDDNRSHDLQASVRHEFPGKNPRFAAGYRIRYLDFRRESEGGYFDPSGYISHKLEGSLDWEKGRVYVYLAPFLGHQSFRRRGTDKDGFFSGGEGVLGVNVTGALSLELHGEGSDEAGATASGFNYYQVGVRARWRL